MVKEKFKKKYMKWMFCFSGMMIFWGMLFNPFYLIRRNLFRNIRKQSLKLQGKLLDFGCGSKPYKELFTKCNQYIGCDIEISGHEHKNENIDFFYDGKHLPFDNHFFDSIFSSEVFEHIFNLDEILKELNRVIIPDGKMLLTIPFVWNEHEIPYDCARYTSFGIKEILHRNGFEIIASEKSTLYIETIFQMVIEYIRILQNKISRNICFSIVCQILFVAPLNFIGFICGHIFPENDSLYCNNIILCKKVHEVNCCEQNIKNLQKGHI